MKAARESAMLTVAAIRRSKGEGAVQYLFHQRQRIFLLRPGAKVYGESSKLLRQGFGQESTGEGTLRCSATSSRKLRHARLRRSRDSEGRIII